MEFSIKLGSPEKQRSGCVVVGVFEGGKLSDAAKLLDVSARGALGKIIARGDMSGKVATTLLLHNVPNVLCERVLLVGLGEHRELSARQYIECVRAAMRALCATGAKDAALGALAGEAFEREFLVPEDFAVFGVEAPEFVGDAGDDGDFADTGGRLQILNDEGREEIVHLAGFGREFRFPEELNAASVGFGDGVVIFEPAGACGVSAGGKEVGGEAWEGETESEERETDFQMDSSE